MVPLYLAARLLCRCVLSFGLALLCALYRRLEKLRLPRPLCPSNVLCDTSMSIQEYRNSKTLSAGYHFDFFRAPSVLRQAPAGFVVRISGISVRGYPYAWPCHAVRYVGIICPLCALLIGLISTQSNQMYLPIGLELTFASRRINLNVLGAPDTGTRGILHSAFPPGLQRPDCPFPQSAHIKSSYARYHPA